MDVDVEAHAGERGAALLVGVESPAVGAVVDRPVVGRGISLEALAAHRLFVDRPAETGEDRVPVAAGVVDRHVPLRDRHLRVHRDHEGLREQDVGDADVGVRVADPAQRLQPHAIVGALDANFRPVVLSQYFADRHLRIGRRAAELPAVARRGVLVLEEAVQPGGMRRVDADLERLQPVAVPVPLEREGVLVRRDEAVEARKRRRLAGAEIGEEDAASFRHRIRAQPDVLAKAASRGLGGRLQALAADVVKPAVERAAQTAVLQPAISEIRAAVRAVPL